MGRPFLVLPLAEQGGDALAGHQQADGQALNQTRVALTSR